MDTVLILGGYGAAGKTLAELLLRHSEVGIIIAGRDLRRAQQVAQDLQCEAPQRSVQAVRADAADVDSLHTAFTGANWVILAATVPEYARQVAATAITAGCHFLDILISPSIWPEMMTLADEAEAAGRYLITQGGFHPGLLAPLVRYMAADFEEYDTAAIGMSMNFRLPSVRAAREIIEEAYDFRADLYHDGQWRPARWSQTRTFDFGLAPGKRPCVAMSSLELRDLPAELGLRELGCYVAGFNWFVDGVVFPLIYLLGKIRKGLALDQMLRLFKWGMDTFSPAVPWTVVQLEAAGREHQQASAVVLRLSHADGYFFTAACVLAALRQVWGGALGHPGLRQMGLAVDPTRMLADLEALGVKVERW